MDNFTMLAIVPLGYADKVIEAANEAGASGATIFRARGADHTHAEGFLSFKVEPEEEIVLITATGEVINAICAKIHEKFEKDSARDGSIYILPAR